MVRSGLVRGLERVGLRGGPSALHGGGARGAEDALLAAQVFLLLGCVAGGGRGGRGFGGAGVLGGGVVVDSTHVVVEVPAAGEAVARDRAVASFKEAEVGVVAVAVEAVGLALVTEETSVGGELELSVHAGRDLAAVGLQVRVQVFAVFVSSQPDIGARGLLTDRRTFAWWEGGCKAFLRWQMGSSTFRHCG